jgi:hypothetical protein
MTLLAIGAIGIATTFRFCSPGTAGQFRVPSWPRGRELDRRHGFSRRCCTLWVPNTRVSALSCWFSGSKFLGGLIVVGQAWR